MTDVGVHIERHNLEITCITPGKEYYCYCSQGDLNQTCRTEEAARQVVFNHAVEDARISS